MKRLALVLSLLITPKIGAAQAPDAAGLWDVASTTLARPAALETSATGAFWNPTAILEGSGLRTGVQTIETPAALGLSGILAAATQAIGSRIGVGLLFGRVQVADLVRTTTSPVSQTGDIPAYEQFVGLGLGAEFGGGLIRAAAVLRGHDARFDIVHASGLTLDLGVSAYPAKGVRVAASSQFVSADFSKRPTERFFAGGECLVARPSAWGTPAELTFRYGVGIRARRELEHMLGVGLGLGPRLTIDSGLHREQAFGDEAWRFALEVTVRAGRYAIAAARGGGIEGLGANYRVGLDVGLSK